MVACLSLIIYSMHLEYNQYFTLMTTHRSCCLKMSSPEKFFTVSFGKKCFVAVKVRLGNVGSGGRRKAWDHSQTCLWS